MRSKKLILKRARIEELAREEVKRIIGEEHYQKIKSVDPHPFFVNLLVAHEGISQGKILDDGLSQPAKKLWLKERIKELANKLNPLVNEGALVPIYLFHDPLNRARSKVGEILSAMVKRVKDKLSVLALAYISDSKIRDQIRKGELDTCSLEAELVFEKRENPVQGKNGMVDWVVNAVEKVTGVALGSRRFCSPGFSGAMVLAQVEEFEEDFSGSEGLKQELEEKEKEIEELRQELARYKEEKEKKEQRRRVEELVGQALTGRNLKAEEQRLVIEMVRERVELKKPGDEELGLEVKKELERELARLNRLRRIYQKSSAVISPLEQEEPSRKNPLIPGE